MANDERRSETFIREVDEELRREQLQTLWNRFGWIFIGICVLIVLITAGYRGWIWWEDRQAAQAGDRFLAALEEMQSGNREEGEAALQAIADEGRGGYAALARLRLAGVNAAAGDKEAALADYDRLAADASLSLSIRDLARVRAALLALDAGDTAGATERAEPLNVAGNPWRHVARDILGTAAYQEGRLDEARDYFLAIQQDAETPSATWVRAGMMISLIDGELPEAGSDSAAPDTQEGTQEDTQDGAATQGMSSDQGAEAAAGTETAPEAGSQPATQLEVPEDATPVMDLEVPADAVPMTGQEPAMQPDAVMEMAPEAATPEAATPEAAPDAADDAASDTGAAETAPDEAANMAPEATPEAAEDAASDAGATETPPDGAAKLLPEADGTAEPAPDAENGQ